MLEPIYRLNRWYDDLDKEHGVLRFFLAIIPLGLFSAMINWPGWSAVNVIGLIGFAIFAALRIIPFAFPRRP